MQLSYRDHLVKPLLISAAVLFSTVPAAEETILTGCGATFPYPLYKKWIEVYSQEKNVSILYNPGGSGLGIKSLREYSVDFGATDIFLSDGESADGGDTILHIPTCVGAIVLTYNLPGNPRLRLTPEQIADLFSGRIKKWNCEKLKRTNPGATLPDCAVKVIHRSEGSGSTAILTHYLSTVSAAWMAQVGSGKQVRWPVGMGVEGNAGVVEMVHRISGSIGYIELSYAQNDHLPYAAVGNQYGEYIVPDVETVSRAAMRQLPADARTFLSDATPRGAYPISAFTYIIVRREQAYSGRTRCQAAELVNFLWWLTHEAQSFNRELVYAPLPRDAVLINEKTIGTMRYDGQVLSGMENASDR